MTPPMTALAAAHPITTRRRWAFAVLALAILLANMVIVAMFPAWQGEPAPEWPVAVDLLLVIPLLYLLLFARLGWAAVWRALAMAGLGVVAGSFIIPPESKQLWLVLEPLRYVVVAGVVIAQLGVIVWVVSQILAVRHAENLEVALNRALDARLGRDGIARLIRLEARVWLYALLRTVARQPFPGQRHFHVGAQGMNASNQQGFLILIGAEIPIAHVLVALFDPLIAAVVTALSIYGFLFMLAEYRATLLRPISVNDDGLQVRYGVVFDSHIDWASITAANPCQGPVRRARGQLRLIGMGEANVVLELADGTRVNSVIGDREMRRIVLGVDDPAGFLAEVRARLDRKQPLAS